MNRFVIAFLIAVCVVCSSTILVAQDQTLPEVSSNEEMLSALSGDKITLNVEAVNIRNLLTMLAHARRLNIVAAPDVTGTISVNLFEVPFKDALDSILSIGGYTYFQKGEVIFVVSEGDKSSLPIGMTDLKFRTYKIHHADLGQLQATISQFISPSGKIVTTADGQLIVQDAPQYLKRIDELVAALDISPRRAEVFEITHADPATLITTITNFLSPNGKISQSGPKNIVVQDSPEYISEIARLVDELDVPPRQVLISAKILNVSRDNDLSLGVDFESSSIVDPRSAAFDASLPLIEDSRANIETLTTGQLGVFSLIIRGNEQGFLDALSTKNNVETLAAPQLVALDGQLSKIQVGDRLGYRITTTTQTSSLESILFLDLGTLLEVTPAISKNGIIRMTVHPEVSIGSISSEGLPQKKTTEATTSMWVRNGETILIGGLLNITKQRTRSQVPVLGSIPILGLLFGKNTWTDIKSELVILITPYIVEPDVKMFSIDEKVDWVEQHEENLSIEKTDVQRLFNIPSTEDDGLEDVENQE